MEFIEKTCPFCGGILQVPDDLHAYICMYCGKKIDAKGQSEELGVELNEGPRECLNREPNEPSSWFEEEKQYAYTEGPSLLIGQLHLMDSFKAATYEKAFQNYLGEKGKIILALNRCITEEVRCKNGTASERIEEWVKVVIDQVDKQVGLSRRGNKSSANTKKIEEVRYVLALYTVPMIKEVAVDYSDQIAATLHRLWCERYPQQKFEIAQYKALLSGFQKRKLCFITTAACECLDKPDDCVELQAFRRFRDGYLMNRPGGKEEIEWYYEVAPVIVNKMNILPEKMEIYTSIWEEYLQPCYDFLKEQENEKCYKQYKQMVETLSRTYVLS